MSEYGINLEYLDHIAIIKIDRPQRLNTFNEIMWTELEEVIVKLKQDIPRVAILTGAGNKSFSAGFDVSVDNPQVSSLIEAIKANDRSPVEKLIRRIRNIVDSVFNLPVPIIAAINGNAYGGGAELAVRCDLRFMEPDAVICFSEVRLGLMPDWGGTAVLPRLVGPANAADMILTAREVNAEEALSLGLINHISSPTKVLSESIDLAERIAQNGPSAVRFALEVIRSTSNISLKEALELEMEKAISLITSGECFHGISAFLSKKEPKFPNSKVNST